MKYSEQLRKTAEALRKEAQKAENEKTIKCAKYILGLKALVQLNKKVV